MCISKSLTFVRKSSHAFRSRLISSRAVSSPLHFPKPEFHHAAVTLALSLWAKALNLAYVSSTCLKPISYLPPFYQAGPESPPPPHSTPLHPPDPSDSRIPQYKLRAPPAVVFLPGQPLSEPSGHLVHLSPTPNPAQAAQLALQATTAPASAPQQKDALHPLSRENSYELRTSKSWGHAPKKHPPPLSPFSWREPADQPDPLNVAASGPRQRRGSQTMDDTAERRRGGGPAHLWLKVPRARLQPEVTLHLSFPT